MKIKLNDGKILNFGKNSNLEKEYKLKDCTIYQLKNDMYLTIDSKNNYESCEDSCRSCRKKRK